jgi:hypothetical protein
MIAAPTIKTPQGELAVEIEFGRPVDADRLRGWRVAKDHPLSHAMQDALEFGKLAGKRWRYYLKREEAALSLDELVRGIASQPQAEIGFLLVAKPTWKPAPRTLGIAWCRRTWCNHIVLDFLAAHPSTLGKDYAGIGTALLYSTARVAGRIQAPLVWGEATALSAPFYRRVLDVEGILDHFFIPEDTLEKMCQRLNLRTKPSKS